MKFNDILLVIHVLSFIMFGLFAYLESSSDDESNEVNWRAIVGGGFVLVVLCTWLLYLILRLLHTHTLGSEL